MKTKLFSLFFVLCVLFLGACQGKKSPDSSGSGNWPQAIKEMRTVYFEFDSSNIRSDQVPVLQANGEVLRKHPDWRVTVEGHCDERGTNEYNLALGDRRARSVRDYLVNLGSDPSRLNAASYGEERPVCMEHDESCWQLNRRGEFVK